MIAIVNVSDPDTPTFGINKYEVRINNTVIARFDHDRQYSGAAQCLRDAANAVEKCRAEDQAALLKELLPLFDKGKIVSEED